MPLRCQDVLLSPCFLRVWALGTEDIWARYVGAEVVGEKRGITTSTHKMLPLLSCDSGIYCILARCRTPHCEATVLRFDALELTTRPGNFKSPRKPQNSNRPGPISPYDLEKENGKQMTYITTKEKKEGPPQKKKN